MTAGQNKIHKVLIQFYNELCRGNRLFLIAKGIYKASKDTELMDRSYFFSGAYEACLREALLSLAKVTEVNDDSITIHYLLNIALKNRNAFDYASPDEIKTIVSEHKKQLEREKCLMKDVEKLRDKIIAHLDRKHINNPNAISFVPVNMSKVGELFERLLKMLNVYKQYYDNGEFIFTLKEHQVQEEINYLIQLLDKDQNNLSNL